MKLENEALLSVLLQHPEALALLEIASFELVNGSGSDASAAAELEVTISAVSAMDSERIAIEKELQHVLDGASSPDVVVVQMLMNRLDRLAVESSSRATPAHAGAANQSQLFGDACRVGSYFRIKCSDARSIGSNITCICSYASCI